MVKSTDGHSSNYDGGWMFLLQNISASLPDMNLVFNHRDELRIAFDARAPNTDRGALTVNDAAPFQNQPAPTSKFYTDEKHCLVPNAPNGFLTYANNANSFLLYSALLAPTSLRTYTPFSVRPRYTWGWRAVATRGKTRTYVCSQQTQITWFALGSILEIFTEHHLTSRSDLRAFACRVAVSDGGLTGWESFAS
ncbi:hypothetical protein R3P38DRAFT_1782541 [Favolaschia claudopus]|uniref:Uncharacterized protein n=1 Tax=Favolaschia claudopus TaxID=2862362 RepID=A0AAW0A6X4_9AGAR